MNSVCKYTKYSWYCVACKTKRIKKGMFLWQKRNLVCYLRHASKALTRFR